VPTTQEQLSQRVAHLKSAVSALLRNPSRDGFANACISVLGEGSWVTLLEDLVGEKHHLFGDFVDSTSGYNLDDFRAASGLVDALEIMVDGG